MCKHEQKNCPRCNAGFECKIGDIAQCQCNSIQLNEEESKFIASQFTDCLCAGCMKAMKSEYGLVRFNDWYDLIRRS